MKFAAKSAAEKAKMTSRVHPIKSIPTQNKLNVTNSMPTLKNNDKDDTSFDNLIKDPYIVNDYMLNRRRGRDRSAKASQDTRIADFSQTDVDSRVPVVHLDGCGYSEHHSTNSENESYKKAKERVAGFNPAREAAHFQRVFNVKSKITAFQVSPVD